MSQLTNKNNEENIFYVANSNIIGTRLDDDDIDDDDDDDTESTSPNSWASLGT